jgi:hypothetical protein
MARHKEGKKGKAAAASTTTSSRNSNRKNADTNAAAAGRIAKINNAKDAGFTGQDAFQTGEDEIRLDNAES